MRMYPSRAWLGGFGLWLTLQAVAVASPPVQREGVLGTSFEMQVEGDDRHADAAVAAALAEVARLEGELSTWRADSALSAYNAGRLDTQALPVAATEVLTLCEQWRERSEGAFSCRLGAAIAQWHQAEVDGQLPDRSALRRQARALAALALPHSGPLDPSTGLRFDVDGLAKGYILDRALERARVAAPHARGIRIDIGGDALYWGTRDDGSAWPVAIADPLRPLDNVAGIAQLQLRSQAIAASGHRSRGYTIGRRHFSHILDPQEGWPMAYAPSATVVAGDAVTADALATALSVLPIRDGLALVDRIDGAAALIVSDTGIAFASTRWPALLTDTVITAAPPRLIVDYEIPHPGIAAGYRQPYVALWIEREDGTPVRQLHVLGDRTRWLSELPQWWRHYGRNDPAGALGIARPTRAPGRYSVAWDGRDDRGQAVPNGRYVLRVEAARERGGHELLAVPFVLDPSQAIDVQRHGDAEIGQISLSSRPPEP
jgi:thiamine biosynthesis lipoprotein